MNTEPLELSVDLIDDKVKFTGKTRNNPPIIMDYIPPIGDGNGYMPLEMVLMSLATCSGSTLAILVRSMKKSISGLKVSARGIRREEHPTGFKEIHLDFAIQSPDLEEPLVQKAIQMSEETYCPVWDMLKGNVTITTAFTITAPA